MCPFGSLAWSSLQIGSDVPSTFYDGSGLVHCCISSLIHDLAWKLVWSSIFTRILFSYPRSTWLPSSFMSCQLDWLACIGLWFPMLCLLLSLSCLGLVSLVFPYSAPMFCIRIRTSLCPQLFGVWVAFTCTPGVGSTLSKLLGLEFLERISLRHFHFFTSLTLSLSLAIPLSSWPLSSGLAFPFLMAHLVFLPCLMSSILSAFLPLFIHFFPSCSLTSGTSLVFQSGVRCFLRALPRKFRILIRPPFCRSRSFPRLFTS